MEGRYTPEVEEAISRLGAKMSYRETREEIERLLNVDVSESTVRAMTIRNGKAGEAVAKAEEARHLQEQPEVSASGEQMSASVDGSFIHLTTGEWKEVKLATIGVIETRESEEGKVEPKITEVSYHARMETSEAFTMSALPEWQRRGCEKAKTLVAINDGATWIDSFFAYHAPKGVRILDFAHAVGYLSQIARAFYGQESEEGEKWLATARKQLREQPPEVVLGMITPLLQNTVPQERKEAIETGYHYLHQRQNQIHYAFFRQCGYPIGSGTVESGNKQVVQSRMKRAGMRWHPSSVNPMLHLRTALCNQRWDEEWQKLIQHRQEEKKRKQRKKRKALSLPTQENQQIAPVDSGIVPSLSAPPPPSLSLVEDTPSLPSSRQPHKPAPDHPWRRGFPAVSRKN